MKQSGGVKRVPSIRFLLGRDPCVKQSRQSFLLFEPRMSNPTYDPQTLDNYEPFHKEFGKKEFAIMGAFTAVFAPFGYFIGIPFLHR